MRNLMKSALSAAVIFLGIVATAPAQAMTFNFSVVSIGAPSDIASGTITADLSSPGIYSLTGITGTFDGSTITGLSYYANADNKLFYPAQPYVDFQGISFETASLGAINLFSNSGYFEVKSSVDGVGYYSSGSPISIGVSATPLPPAWTMMLIGLAGFGFVAYRRKSKPALLAA